MQLHGLKDLCTQPRRNQTPPGCGVTHDRPKQRTEARLGGGRSRKSRALYKDKEAALRSKWTKETGGRFRPRSRTHARHSQRTQSPANRRGLAPSPSTHTSPGPLPAPVLQAEASVQAAGENCPRQECQGAREAFRPTLSSPSSPQETPQVVHFLSCSSWEHHRSGGSWVPWK